MHFIVKGRFILGLAFLLVAQTQFADAADTADPRMGPHLDRYRVQGIYAKNTYGSTYSGLLSWDPQFFTTKRFSFRGNLGLSLFKGNLDNRFFVAEIGCSLAYHIRGWDIEGAAGLQPWLTMNISPYLGLNFIRSFSKRFLGPFSSVIFGYTRLIGGNSADEFKAGLGIQF